MKFFEKDGVVSTSIEEVYAFAGEDDLDPRVFEADAFSLFSRHGLDFPSIFGASVTNPMDFGSLESVALNALKTAGHTVVVYVTGMTPAVVAVINACHEMHKDLILMHFNKQTGRYKAQFVY